jgi:hypothetical protein
MIRTYLPTEKLCERDRIDTIAYYRKEIVGWKKFKAQSDYMLFFANDQIKFLEEKIKAITKQDD